MTSHGNHLKQCFQQPSIVAYRRFKNLRDHLIRAKLTKKRKSTRQKNGYRDCHQGCQLCWHSVKTSTHKCHHNGKTWSIFAPIDCNTTNVIYKLLCKKCRDFCYIGETKSERIAEHRGYILQKKTNQVTGHHFNMPGHTEADLQVVGIERVLPLGDPLIRKSRESYWINQYFSTKYGQNKRD